MLSIHQVQFGVSGASQVSAVYRGSDSPASGAIIPNDPVVASNRAGYVAFSAAYNSDKSAAVNRTTEIYINYKDNSAKLDRLGFAPFGVVTRGDSAGWRKEP